MFLMWIALALKTISFPSSVPKNKSKIFTAPAFHLPFPFSACAFHRQSALLHPPDHCTSFSSSQLYTSCSLRLRSSNLFLGLSLNVISSSKFLWPSVLDEISWCLLLQHPEIFQLRSLSPCLMCVFLPPSPWGPGHPVLALPPHP